MTVITRILTKGVLYVGVVALMAFSVLQVDKLKDYLTDALGIVYADLSLDRGNYSNSALIEYSSDSCKVDLQKTNLQLVPERLVIENIQLDLPIISVPLTNGTWQVHDYAANYAESTSYINSKSGNIGIYGHDRPQALTRIKELLAKDEIILISGEYKAKYVLIDELIVEPNEIDVFYPTEEPMLTLATCDGRFSEKRFVTRAQLVSIERINCESK